MLDIHAIITLTEPARSHPDAMARAELADDLYRLIRTLEDRHCLPVADPAHPAMRLRSGLMETLRGFEALHQMTPRLISPRRRSRAA